MLSTQGYQNYVANINRRQSQLSAGHLPWPFPPGIIPNRPIWRGSAKCEKQEYVTAHESLTRF